MRAREIKCIMQTVLSPASPNKTSLKNVHICCETLENFSCFKIFGYSSQTSPPPSSNY